jgi:hypothetical protein
MVAHRKNVPPRQAHVPSSWFIVLTVLVLIGGAGWLGWLVLDHDSMSETASPSTAAETLEPTAPAKGSPEPSQSPEPTETTAPAAKRTATVSVLNNSGIAGAAKAFSAKVTQAGWTLGGIGNWTGSIGSNTVYYPPGMQEQGKLLAADVDIDRVQPSVAPMRPDRLTIILSGPQ